MFGFFETSSSFTKPGCIPGDGTIYNVVFTIYESANPSIYMSLVVKIVSGGVNIYIKGKEASGNSRTYFDNGEVYTGELMFSLLVGKKLMILESMYTSPTHTIQRLHLFQKSGTKIQLETSNPSDWANLQAKIGTFTSPKIIAGSTQQVLGCFIGGLFNWNFQNDLAPSTIDISNPEPRIANLDSRNV